MEIFAVLTPDILVTGPPDPRALKKKSAPIGHRFASNVVCFSCAFEALAFVPTPVSHCQEAPLESLVTSLSFRLDGASGEGKQQTRPLPKA